MEIVDLIIVVHPAFVGAIGKHRTQTVHCLAFPRTYLVGVHFVPGRNLLDRLVATQRIKRNASLEIRRKPSSGRHIVFLHQMAEYTLNNCPVFWDHLIDRRGRRRRPVPLHWTRLFGRRYNQAALLAVAIGKATGVTVAPDVLVRRRRTPSQGRLGPAQRRHNLRGAFIIDDGHRALIDGHRVLLIDDVLTTGATASACTRVLLAAGAASVDVLTLARVVRADV